MLDWISGFSKFDGRWGIKLGLERMEALLEKLGNPHQELKYIHVAGTNGKGSTCAYLASIYQAAGYRVGRYTSPYIMHFFDRMSINGTDVTEAQLEKYARQLKPHIEALKDTELGEPTEFEVITLLAILFFLDQEVDLVIWETGLGGRLDATNVVTPLASIITNVGLDHLVHLGSTIEKIAAEKAGIIKPQIPAFTGASEPALSVIAMRAAELNAPLFVLGQDLEYIRRWFSFSGQGFNFKLSNYQLKDLEISMLGEHQCKNASLAIGTVLYLTEKGLFPVSEEALRKGLKETRWPGRLEVVSKDPLVLLDGAHNPHGSEALAEALKDLFEPGQLILVIGILQDKLVPGVLEPLLPFARTIIVTAPDSPRAADVGDVRRFLRDLVSLPIEVVPPVSEAIEYALSLVQDQEAVLVTGSLYTISEARHYICWKG